MVYGLFSDKPGDFVKKPMRECTGKVSMGVVRTTYLIDEEGIIIRANDKVKAAEDPENMLGEL